MAAASSKYKLVIVESPAKAKTIGKFLGRGYKVEACNGHVRDLPKSQLGVDIDQNFEPRYITIRGRGEILDRIRKEARGASKVILATDPDREGEAISWHLANILKIDPESNCRVEFNEITAPAIKAAMKKPRPIDLQLVDAQQARRVLDRLVGYKISPLLWVKVRKGLSAGRVQSVATRMIVDREAEIDAFIPQEYWTLTANFTDGSQKFTAKYVGSGDEKTDIISAVQAKALRGKLVDQKFSITSVKTGERRKNPQPPFTTSNLQQEAVRKLSFTTKKTMQIAQMLYEGVDIEGEGTVGLISYIRTDSTRLSDEALTAARDYISANFAPEYLPETPNIYKGRKNAQDAHEAIRPTHALFSPEKVKSSLTRDQYRLYKLIYDRYLASQMTPAVYDTLAVELGSGEAQFRFGGMKKKFAGFTVLYEESQDEPAEKESNLPKVQVGDQVTMKELDAEQHFTQPPARYTEASLVRAMEEKGIGRPSTYAPTITTILARGYVARENKALVPTELGQLVTDMMTENFKSIVDVQFTADMEEDLDTIEEEGKDWHKVVKKFYDPFAVQLAQAEKNIEKVEVKDEVSDVKCDKCGAMMVYKMGRFGRFLACPNFPECRNTMPIVRTIDAHCPKCGGAILVRNTKRGRVFYGCEHYPECDFTSWDMPVDDRCPVCGSPMVLKRDRKKDVTWHLCTNETCKHRVEVENPAAEEAE